MTDREKIEAIHNHLRVSWRQMALTLGMKSPQTLSDIRSGRHGISPRMVERILAAYPFISRKWLVLNEGEMLKAGSGANLIPVYGQANTLSGTKAVSESEIIGSIGFGSCFIGATAAVRNNSESMAEYPIGAILALRKVDDISLLVPGQNYLIETDEFCVVKRLHREEGSDMVSLYSTSTARYPDGKAVFEPFSIPADAIKDAYAVMGYVYDQTMATPAPKV